MSIGWISLAAAVESPLSKQDLQSSQFDSIAVYGRIHTVLGDWRAALFVCLGICTWSHSRQRLKEWNHKGGRRDDGKSLRYCVNWRLGNCSFSELRRDRSGVRLLLLLTAGCRRACVLRAAHCPCTGLLRSASGCSTGRLQCAPKALPGPGCCDSSTSLCCPASRCNLRAGSPILCRSGPTRLSREDPIVLSLR
jgi:hypothetical protein